MEQLLTAVLNEEKSVSNTFGVLLIEKSQENFIKEFDFVVVVIGDVEHNQAVKHYDINEKAVEIQYVNKNEINRVLLVGSNRRLIDWLLNGSVFFEKDSYVSNLRLMIEQFPINDRKYKITIEFSKLIRRYVDGKQLFQNGHMLDAFNSILHSLHHLARLSVIESGNYPEVTVWQQVKQIDPEIYKLYDEMVMGEETLEKRLELLLLAINFALTSKAKLGASHLIEVMQQSKEPWSIEALMNHPEIKEYAIDFTVLLEYLVQKGMIDIVKGQTDIDGVLQRLYFIKS